jgi:uncharacterized protein YjeT (DUF2065 family)
MSRKFCIAAGIGLIVIGLVAFVRPGVGGMHLTHLRTAIHFAVAAVAIYLAMKGSMRAVRVFCIAIGLVFLLLGIAGFVAGRPSGTSVPGPADIRMLHLIPGSFELGTRDHMAHLAFAAIFLIAGLTVREGVRDSLTTAGSNSR